MTEMEQPVTNSTPVCYRHSDRETRVSCGRCGKPLCPECVMHGPVGVRCRECLLPQGASPTSVRPIDPARLRSATALAVALAVFWIVVLIAVAVNIYSPGGGAPNLLLAAVAGGTIGWVIRRWCGGAWNGASVLRAVLLAAAVPLAAAMMVTVLSMAYGGLLFSVVFGVRAIVAIGVAVLAAWLSSSGRTS